MIDAASVLAVLIVDSIINVEAVEVKDALFSVGLPGLPISSNLGIAGR